MKGISTTWVCFSSDGLWGTGFAEFVSLLLLESKKWFCFARCVMAELHCFQVFENASFSEATSTREKIQPDIVLLLVISNKIRTFKNCIHKNISTDYFVISSCLSLWRFLLGRLARFCVWW